MESPPVFIVALPRFKERYAYITDHVTEVLGGNFETIGVDGLSGEIESIAYPPLRPGELGCVSSHLKIYQAMVDRKIAQALIIEDDVVLPENISEIIDHARRYLDPSGIVQLYNWGLVPKFSSVSAVKIPGGSLYWPMSPAALGSACTYLMSYGAAEGILGVNRPIKVTADNWSYFFEQGALDAARVMIPSPVRLMNFETTIRPRASGSGPVASLARMLRSTVLKRALAFRRRTILARHYNDLEIVPEPSLMMSKADRGHRA